MRKQAPTDLAKRLVWLSTFRVVAVTALVALGTVVSLRGSEAEATRAIAALSALAVAVNLLQLGVAILMRLRRGLLSTLAAAQLAGDLVFATFLVLFTGLEDSLFGFVFPLVVVSGGILLGVAGAWSAAAISLGLWAGMLLLRQQGWLGPLMDLQPFALGWAGVGKLLFAQGSASILSAALVSYVARQEQRAGKRAEEAESTLEELNVLHDAIVRSLASGIATTDPSGRITLLNRAGEEILGLSAEDLVGKPLETVFPSLGEALAEAEEAHRLERTWRTPDGRERILGFTLTPLVTPEGERMGLTAVFQNLTEYKELEARAARSERLAAVGEVAAGLAHELRNPLGAISGSIELIAENREAADERLLTIAMREMERLDDLVASFLEFARPPPPILETVELSRLIEETCALLASDPQAGVWERKLSEATARADGAQLKQVVWNLMRNAAEASQGAGGLSITCGAVPERGEVFLCVADRGCGMDESTKRRIFDPFFTTKEGGTGLGLATVHRIVDGLGGRLEVESELGQGTEVRLFLPVAEA